MIFARSPEDPSRVLVKRIVALNGDIVNTLPPWPESRVKVPVGHVWVEGLTVFMHFTSEAS